MNTREQSITCIYYNNLFYIIEEFKTLGISNTHHHYMLYEGKQNKTSGAGFESFCLLR